MSKISVIIPIYQVESYITECLQSVIYQTYKDIEIICVDDCGSDNSIAIVEDFAKEDSRIKIIYHPYNKGLGPARNTGLDNATGEYIFFVDSDDTITPNILEILYNSAVEGREDIVVSKTHVYANNPENREMQKTVEDIGVHVSYTSEVSCKANMDNFTEVLSQMGSVVWGKLFLRDFLEENAVRFIDKKIVHEDDGFIIKIVSNFPRISWVNTIGVLYRIHSESLTAKIRQPGNEVKKIYHMEQVLSDVCDYINQQHSKTDANIFIRKIKCNSIYARFYNKKTNFLGIRLYRNIFNSQKKERHIKICGIKIFVMK